MTKEVLPFIVRCANVKTHGKRYKPTQKTSFKCGVHRKLNHWGSNEMMGIEKGVGGG